MAERAAIVTGASSGIGLAITEMLASEGYAVTMAARRPDKLAAAAEQLRGAGHEIHEVAGNVSDEETIKRVVAEHRDRCGRLDVLVNNAGVGIGAAVAEIDVKKLDLQLDVNIRSIVLFYREAIELLRAAGSEHRNALVVNTASIAGKRGQAWLSVYSATKFALVGWTEAMNRELAADGIKNVALCPAFVATPMTDFLEGQVETQDMIQPSDISEMVRALLRLSPACVVPELMFERAGEAI